MMSVLAPAVGWLIPGAGHMIQKRWIRGLLLFVSVMSLNLTNSMSNSRAALLLNWIPLAGVLYLSESVGTTTEASSVKVPIPGKTSRLC